MYPANAVANVQKLPSSLQPSDMCDIVQAGHE